MNRRCLWHKPNIYLMVRYDIIYCNRSLDNYYSMDYKCKQLVFPLDGDFPSYLLVCFILRMEFHMESLSFGILMSNQSIILTIVLACQVSWPSRVPIIPSLMIPFLAMKRNTNYYSIPFWFMMMLAISVTWSPKGWSRYSWRNHPFYTLF